MIGAALGMTLRMTLLAAVASVSPPALNGQFTPPAAVGAVSGARCETDTGHILGDARSHGARFIATTGGLVIEHADGSQAVWTACDGLPATYVQAVTLLPDGDLAVAYRGLGVWRLDPRHGTQAELAGDAAALRWVTALAWHDGALWVGTLQHGLWRLGTEGAAPAFKSRFRKGRVSALVSQTDGSLLIGRDLGGLWRLSSTGRFRRLLRGSVQGIVPDGGRRILVDQGHRVCVLDVASKTCTAHNEALAMPAEAARPLHITSLAVHSDGRGTDRLWAGTFDRGVLVQVDGAWQRPAGLGAPPRMVNQLVSVDGSLWAATPTGAFRLHDGAWQRFGEHSGLPTDHVNAVHVDDSGAVWFATSRGLATWREGGGMHRIDQERGLPYRIVYSLTRAHGRIVAGTAYGLGVIRAGAFDVYRVGAGGLSDDWINAVAEGPGGSLLIGTYDRGVDRLRGGLVERVPGLEAAWVNPGGLHASQATGGVFVATLGDGLYHLAADDTVTHWPGRGALPSGDVTSVQAFDGRLWIGTREGLASWPMAAVLETPADV